MNGTKPMDFCPYKGLQPYTEEDRKYFFGRNRDREIICANLNSTPLTILHGASGVGKSSVLMAGVAPQLAKSAGTIVIVFRNWQSGDYASALKGEVLSECINSLGDNLEDVRRLVDSRIENEESILIELQRRLQDKQNPPTPSDERLAQNKRMMVEALRLFKKLLNNDDPKLVEFDDLLLSCSLVSGKTFLFIFDQFEEYFLYSSADGANGFDAEFARTINRQDIDSNFLLSLREDGLSKLDRFQGRIPHLFSNMLRLEHLDLESAEDAIRKPLIKYKSEFPGGTAPVDIENGLVEALLVDARTDDIDPDQVGLGQVAGQGGAALEPRIETPFLQMVLIRLWQEELKNGSSILRLETLNKLGGAKSIVRTHLDDVMKRLGQTDKDYLGVAALLFRHLVTPSGMKIAQTQGDLASMADLTEGRVKPVITVLDTQRILRRIEAPVGTGGDARYEIFHDVLARPVLDWSGRYLKDQKLIVAEQEAKRERTRAEKEAKSAQRLRYLLAALLVVILFAIGSSVWALSNQERAESNRSRALNSESRALMSQLFAMSQAAEANTLKRMVDTQNKSLAIKVEELEKASRDLETESDRADARARDAVIALGKMKAAQDRAKCSEAQTNAIKDEYIVASRGAGATLTMGQLEQKIAELCSGNGSPKGRDLAGKLWKNGTTLRVGFLGGSEAQKALIRKYAVEWSSYANIELQFTSNSNAEIRVSFSEEGSSYSYVGTDALGVSKEQPTISLGIVSPNTTEELNKWHILHEFGHVLGLLHENQNPTATIPWNRDAVYDYLMRTFSWDKGDVDRSWFARWETKDLPPKVYDPLSIMMVPFPRDLLIGGGEGTIGENHQLSEGDKEYIAKLYPRN